MTRSNLVITLVVVLGWIGCEAVLPNLINTKYHTCITCLCHAKTGCYSLQNCANYSISYDYWITANAPTVRSNTGTDQRSFRECIANENCIIHTIKEYTSSLGNRDCVCDGVFDCRDMLSMHLYGEGCKPVMAKFTEVRYNNCADTKGLPRLDPNVECVDTDE
ncbi:hypothetical protein Trydic_g3116 [Trypoxylus dichotomus]